MLVAFRSSFDAKSDCSQKEMEVEKQLLERSAIAKRTDLFMMGNCDWHNRHAHTRDLGTKSRIATSAALHVDVQIGDWWRAASGATF